MTYRCWDCCGEEFRESPSQHDRRVHSNSAVLTKPATSQMGYEHRYRMAIELRKLADEIERNPTAHNPRMQIDTSAPYHQFVNGAGRIVCERDLGRVREDWTIRVSLVKHFGRPLPPPVIDRDPGDEA
jgi:hypothetical protein